MGIQRLPIFQFADKSLVQWQTNWAQILNKAIASINLFNSQAPTQQVLAGAGIYNTPSNIFYLNVKMNAPSGATTFGSAYLSATSSGVTVPNSTDVSAFYFRANNYLDVIIRNPETSYPYSVASTGFIMVREYYQ